VPGRPTDMARESSGMRPRSGVRKGFVWLALAIALVGWGCGGGEAEEEDVVRISVEADPGRRSDSAAVAATLWENERALPIHLGPLRHPEPVGMWRERVVRSERGGPSRGRLIFGAGASALVYHLASHTPGFPSDLMESNRLVVFDSNGVTELALWVDDTESGEGTAAFGELDSEPAARLLALAQALGAVTVLGDAQFPIDAGGTARMPFFMPAPSGDWRILREGSLEMMLPPAFARRVVAEPEFRMLRDRFLALYTASLPELSAAVGQKGGEFSIPDLDAKRMALQVLLMENADALRGYLDSVWIEMLVAERRPDSARISLYLHNVTDVEVEAFEMEIPHRRLVSESAGLSNLRLEPTDGSAGLEAHLGQDRIEFRMATKVAPHPRGSQGFAGTLLEYDLTGLGALGEFRTVVLDELRVRVRNRALDSPIPEAHVQRVRSLENPRFAIGREPGVEDFMSGLRHVVESATDGEGVEWDAAQRLFVWRSGRYRLLDDFVPPAGYALVLEAGVEIEVAPGKSLLVRGPLRVEGTQQQPVRIRGASSHLPWGVLAVQGRGKSTLDSDRPRSEIEYLELSGGSEDYLRGVFYSGQLSVYHVDLRLAHASLHGAFADDGLNVKYAAVEILDSSFFDNAADAVDLDWVEGIVRRSSFQRSGTGGDGIDVSGSDVRVEDSVFSDIEDKCLSVGEDSRLVLRGALLRRCGMGVASKDLSLVDVRESVFLDNGFHLSAFEKKPIFGSARIHAADIWIGPSENEDAHDAGSVVEVEDARALPDANLEAMRAATEFSRDRYRELTERRR